MVTMGMKTRQTGSSTELVELRTLEVNRSEVAWARRSGMIPVVKKNDNARGPTGVVYVTNEVAQTLLALHRVGLHLRYSAKFVARFDPYTDDLILSPRR